MSGRGSPGGLTATLYGIASVVISAALLWTAIAIAVLKYRLYDIDRVISRTLA